MRNFILIVSILFLSSCNFNAKPTKILKSAEVKENLKVDFEKDSIVETVFGSDKASNEVCTYLCPEDELWCLSNTYSTRISKAGHIVYLWRCDGDSSHNYWIKG